MTTHMDIFSKLDLIRRFGFRFAEPSSGVVDIHFSSWDTRGTKSIIRVERINQDSFVVARPGRGGTFRLSYDYGPSFPLVRTGPIAIKKRMLGGGWFGDFHKRDERYGDLVASAVIVAATLLRKQYHEIV